ncbi:MAG: glucosamine-6-phosphate deaminase [Candidatus Rokubacteria bacterium]|nr:glucosamine-6-phosphate deaminase [Candidatus Rokubacteria bacterium]MBI4593959.1 glucosamine-6-phosphate deaminase [Candidatus Rokubacteria bacterium]
MELTILADVDGLAKTAADLFRDRLRATPALAMAVPAGRTPRRMYAHMQALQAREPVDFSAMRVFSVDELGPPAPADGYFWRQVRQEFLAWAAVSPARCHPFRVDVEALELMCDDYERSIGDAGGLDLIMLGLGPNGHLASNEPGTPFSTRTRPVRLLASTVDYILTDEVLQGQVSDRAVTLGLATILEAREVVLLVSGALKREPLRQALAGPVTPELPASILQRHPRCTILADRAAAP